MWEKLKTLFAETDLKEGMDILFDFLATVAMWATVALLLGIVLYAVVIRNRDEEKLASARKLILGIVVGYAVGIIVTLGTLKLVGYILNGKINGNFWLVVGLFALAAVGVAVTVLVKRKSPKASLWTGVGFVAAFAVYAVVLLCVIPAKSESYKPLSSWQMYLFSALLVAVIAFLALFFGKSDDYNVKALTYAAICISLSFALSYVKFFSLGQGGSITLASIVPLALYSFMFGPRRGVIAGVVYGLLQFVQSPQFYQPMQVLLDYPIAFGAIGVAGFLRNAHFLQGKTRAQFALGTLVAGLLRFVAHVLSGYYVFSSWNWNPEALSSFAYALLYNVLTILPDLAIALLVGTLALSSKALQKTILAANAAE